MQSYTFVTTDGGAQLLVDTVEHDGGLWLVPGWLASPYPGMQRPARIIRMDLLAHSDLGDISGTGVQSYRLHDPVPRAVLEGRPDALQSSQRFDVQEAPSLDVRRSL
jgi:hypothetical protein